MHSTVNGCTVATVFLLNTFCYSLFLDVYNIYYILLLWFPVGLWCFKMYKPVLHPTGLCIYKVIKFCKLLCWLRN